MRLGHLLKNALDLAEENVTRSNQDLVPRLDPILYGIPISAIAYPGCNKPQKAECKTIGFA